MEVAVSDSGQELRITLSGNLTSNQATGFAERLAHACAGRLKKHIVIDLSGCDSIDTLGFGSLVGFRLTPEVFSRKVTLVGANTAILDQLNILHMKTLFEIADPGAV